MKQIWTGPIARAAERYGEHAPMATACCNACRTCVTTNIFAIVTAGIAGAGFTAGRFVKRAVRAKRT